MTMPAEQPAEQQEQLAAELADVLFDQHAHGLAVVLDGSIQRAEVGHSAEEDAAEQHPQQHRQPAERGGLDRAGDRACARDGGKLMAEDGPAVGGDKVLAVVILDGGRLRLGVDAPGLGEPAAIECVGGDEDDRRDQHDDECVHVISLSFLKKLCSSSMPRSKQEKPPPLPRIFHNENPSQRRRPISRRYPPQISTSALPLCLPNKPAARPLPEWIGERTLLTVGDRLRLLGVCAFHRGCSQGMACPFLAAVLHHQRLSESGDPG